jgi:hypothetical protein
MAAAPPRPVLSLPLNDANLTQPSKLDDLTAAYLNGRWRNCEFDDDRVFHIGQVNLRQAPGTTRIKRGGTIITNTPCTLVEGIVTNGPFERDLARMVFRRFQVNEPFRALGNSLGPLPAAFDGVGTGTLDLYMQQEVKNDLYKDGDPDPARAYFATYGRAGSERKKRMQLLTGKDAFHAVIARLRGLHDLYTYRTLDTSSAEVVRVPTIEEVWLWADLNLSYYFSARTNSNLETTKALEVQELLPDGRSQTLGTLVREYKPHPIPKS